MAHDPRAVVVDVGPYIYTNHPEYGQGAVREVHYSDGTVEKRFVHLRSPAEEAQQGDLPPETGYLLPGQTVDPVYAASWQRDQPNPRTPEAEARDKQVVEKGQREERAANREEEERTRNHAVTGYWETDADKAKRLRDEEDQALQRTTNARQIAAQESANQIAQGRFGIEQEKWGLEKDKPDFLNQATESNPYLLRYNPESGMVEQMQNPNFDAVKQEGERLRQLLATQIQARQTTLEEAKQTYSQWFDSTVKIPLAQSQEARDRAAEQRAALDAEERRRQFAASFGLQKGQLGERAGEAAMTAEQSLLPYRAGPTEGPEMASAINSLAAGGKMDTNAAAGINFSPGAFSFDAPNFKKIAANAAKAALSGLTEYRPAEGQYSTADYSGVPAIGSGAAAPTIPSGYGDFQSIIDQLKSTYKFGGASAAPAQ